jgi:hypothetical protein
MNVSATPGMALQAEIVRGARNAEQVLLKNLYRVECLGADGKTKWIEEFGNLVVDEGLDDLLSQYAKGSGYTASHFVGLTDGTPTPAAGDDMTTHAGWAEIADYDEGTREVLTLGTVSSQSVDNAASKASFAINASVTVGGVFVCTNSTKSGTSGTLYSIGAFAADKVLTSGDTLNVTVTLTTAAA